MLFLGSILKILALNIGDIIDFKDFRLVEKFMRNANSGRHREPKKRGENFCVVAPSTLRAIFGTTKDPKSSLVQYCVVDFLM